MVHRSYCPSVRADGARIASGPWSVGGGRQSRARRSPSCSALTACSGGDGSDATGTDDHGARRRGATPVAATCAAFRRVRPRATSTGPTAPGLLVDATAGGVGCLDRVTFTFQTLGTTRSPPGYARRLPAITEQEPVHRRRPAARSSVAGDAFLVVRSRPRELRPVADARTQARADLPREPIARVRRAPPPEIVRELPDRRRRHGGLGDRPRLGAPVPGRPRRGPAADHGADRLSQSPTQVRSSTMLAEHRVGREEVVGLAVRRRAAGCARSRATTVPDASSGTTSRANACGGRGLLVDADRPRSIVPKTRSRLNIMAPRSSSARGARPSGRPARCGRAGRRPRESAST